MAQDFSVIGKPLPNIDGYERVTGRATFTGDVYLPGMLYAKILRSPHPRAHVKSVDTKKAEALPGVRAVLTPFTVPRKPFSVWHGEKAALGQTIHTAGEGVAAVAATHPYIAEEALTLITVEYEPLPFVLEPEEALKREAPKLAEQGNLVGGKPVVFTRGDVEKGFAEADVTVEESYAAYEGTGNALETRAVVAQWERDRLTLWAANQGPFMVRQEMAQYFGLPQHKVRIISTFVGAGFGQKAGTHPEEVLTALLAKKTGQPVKLILSRAEEMYGGHIRGATSCQLRAGVKRDGTLTALVVKSTTNQGAHGTVFGGLGIQSTGIYRIPNLRTEVSKVVTNKPDYGPVRGVADSYECFALESFMDKVAETITMDPVTFRLKNILRAGDPLDGGIRLSSCGLEECITKGAERIGWVRRKSAGSDPGPKRRGIGMALTTRTGGSDTSTATVKVDGDGSVILFTGATDIGTGARTTLMQILAEELGVTPETISVVSSDTETTPYTRGSWSSSIAFSAGKAVQLAAADAKKKLLETAAPLLQVKPDELSLRGGQIIVTASPDKKLTLAQVVARAGQTILGNATANQPGRPTVARGFAAHFTEVEVNTETGQVKVLRFVAAHDVGKALNPKVVENQIEGGVIQGIALGLTEQLIYDRRTGRPVNANLTDFKVPTVMDVPPIEVVLVEPGEPLGPFGAKGTGETSIQAPMAAIANAVYNATGKRVREIPLTPRRLLTIL